MTTTELEPPSDLQRENDDLRLRLLEAEETLDAIRTGEVDAIVAIGPEGEQVFTLMGAERPYRVLIEAMQEGAATLDREGTLLYANQGLARLVRTPLEHIVGTPFAQHVHPEARAAFERLFHAGLTRPTQEELALRGPRDRKIPVRVSVTPLPHESYACIVVTDVSDERKRDQERDLLARLPLAVGQAEDLGEALHLVLEMVGGSTDWDAGEVWIPRGETLRVFTSWRRSDLADPFLDAGKRNVQRRGTGVAGTAWAEGRPRTSPLTEDTPRRTELAAACGLQVGVAFPVFFRDELIAVVVFYVADADQVDEHRMSVIQAAVAPIAPMVQRRRVEAQVAASLREKEALLKEVHHRVKNNLQVVSALLAMQARRVQDPRVRAHLRDSEARVRSMGLIHESLYKSPDLARIDFCVYLSGLTENILRAYTTAPASIVVSLDVLPVRFGLDMAVPLAGVVNELVTNALKHAFPEEKGNVRISLGRADAEHLVLEVADDGVGAPSGIEGDTRTMGMQIVRTLVTQLDAEMEVIRELGTTFRIRFPYSGAP